jgi:mono/diheme cytochrome c family protein
MSGPGGCQGRCGLAGAKEEKMRMRVGRSVSLLALLAGVLTSAPALALSGQQVYLREGCSVCHGALGEGGVGPTLAGDPFLAFHDYIVGRVLLGGTQMPAFAGKISDQDLAAVASYVRESWGNQLGTVSAQTVAADRQSIEGQAAASGTSRAPQQGDGAQPGSPDKQ